ncbi:hypothetical protein J7M23_04570 [Candidatus Sumerlaeota bacterium]|nr:hypothetical protein [Candidatus Sumerlaeota bacterium]
MKVKIGIKEIRKYLDIETPEFPKYVSPLINLANQYAQGTRPKVVGIIYYYLLSNRLTTALR